MQLLLVHVIQKLTSRAEMIGELLADKGKAQAENEQLQVDDEQLHGKFHIPLTTAVCYKHLTNIQNRTHQLALKGEW